MSQDRPSFVDLSSQMTTPSVLLPPDDPEAAAALETAIALPAEPPEERHTALREVVRRWPALVGGWAHLATSARAQAQDVEAYAFARTGYHRALDRLRGNGWRGMGLVPWAHEPNRAALLAFYELYRAAERIGETPEAERMQKLLLDSDPTDPLGVG